MVDDTAGSEDGTSGNGDDSIVVRRFESGDEERVRELHRAALGAAGTDPDDVPGTDDLRDVESTYLDAGGEFLVATADGELVAIGGLTVEGEDLDPGEGELLRIAVDPGRQREGFGSAVVSALEAAGRERDLDRIVLTTARRQTAATEFYPARGYEEVGRERVGEYELVRFEKELDSGYEPKDSGEFA